MSRLNLRGLTASMLPILGLVATSALMTPAIRRGIEFGDEGYYVQLLVELDRNGFAQTPFRTPHMLTALVQLPLFRLFRFLNESGDGLVLFLRTCYQVLAFCAAVSLYFLISKSSSRLSAFIGASLACTFIPLYLPALSYNTLAMCAFIIAVSTQFLSLHGESKFARGGLMALSCAWWTIGCLSYPTFAIVAGFNFLFILTGIRRNRKLANYALFLTLVFITAGLLTIKQTGLSWLVDSYSYQRAVATGYQEKGNTGVQVEFLKLGFIGPLLLLSASGFTKRLGLKSTLVVLAIVIGHFAKTSPNLPQTHVIVTLLGLSYAIQVVIRNRRSIFDITMLQVTVVFSLVFGLVYVASSGATSMNLALALVVPAALHVNQLLGNKIRLSQLAPKSPVLLLVLVIPYLSFTNHYGDGVVDPTRIDHGVYAGLTTSHENALLLEDYTRILGQNTLAGAKATYSGVNLGLLLDSDLQLVQISPWPIEREATGHAKLSANFLNDLDSLPKNVIIDSHWYLNPFGYQFRCLYELVRSDPLSNGNSLETWALNVSLPVCSP
jgi:hypothetical protein